MESYLFDSVFVVVAALAAFAVSRAGGVRAGLWFVGIALSIVIVLNLFEPVSQILIRFYAPVRSRLSWQYGRFACLLILFSASLALLHIILRWLLPEDPELSPRTEWMVRWGSAGLSGYVVAAFLLVAMHTFPGPPNFGGYFATEPAIRPGALMRFAPDYQLLKVTQVVSENAFPFSEDGALFPADLNMIGDASADGWASFPPRYSLWRANLDKDRREIEIERLEELENAD